MSKLEHAADVAAQEKQRAEWLSVKEQSEYVPQWESEEFQESVLGHQTNYWEYAEAYGATPTASDVDNRPFANYDAMEDTIHVYMNAMHHACDGHRIGHELPALLGSMLSSLERRVYVADKRVKELSRKAEEGMRAQNGTEIESLELESVVGQLDDAAARMNIFQQLLKMAEKEYRDIVGETWTATRSAWGQSQTYAAAQAKRYLRPEDGIPHGTRVVLAGGAAKDCGSEPVFATLDAVKKKHPDIVLITGGAPGVEKWGVEWAQSRDVPVVVFEPDWEQGRKAPFVRNRAIASLDGIRGCIAFEGAGVSENLVELMSEKMVPVMRRHLTPVKQQ